MATVTGDHIINNGQTQTNPSTPVIRSELTAEETLFQLLNFVDQKAWAIITNLDDGVVPTRIE